MSGTVIRNVLSGSKRRLWLAQASNTGLQTPPNPAFSPNQSSEGCSTTDLCDTFESISGKHSFPAAWMAELILPFPTNMDERPTNQNIKLLFLRSLTRIREGLRTKLHYCLNQEISSSGSMLTNSTTLMVIRSNITNGGIRNFEPPELPPGSSVGPRMTCSQPWVWYIKRSLPPTLRRMTPSWSDWYDRKMRLAIFCPA